MVVIITLVAGVVIVIVVVPAVVIEVLVVVLPVVLRVLLVVILAVVLLVAEARIGIDIQPAEDIGQKHHERRPDARLQGDPVILNIDDVPDDSPRSEHLVPHLELLHLLPLPLRPLLLWPQEEEVGSNGNDDQGQERHQRIALLRR